ncbi:E3 ubiquitin-protein ligase ATL4-like [Vicia villosa]|uniref:E3 ubiquitin-protein ligase ATL4-like n=1 Tax=Vicia villosa TaxID=3911 RepID=UPI00273B0A29|nr:E3 ubiquitin-protein ligase ATL4-like [Vicia villosa]
MDTPPTPNHTSSHNNLPITVTVFAVTVIVFLTIYFIFRYRRNSASRRLTPPSSSSTVLSSGNRITPETTSSSSSVVDSLPLFTFSSIKRRSSSVVSGDCAVCLSRFEQNDYLRLLPLCCHAFHAECVDVWLQSNLTCPLCRSAVIASESEVVKISRPASSSSDNSFRLELGNVSNRRGATASENVSGETDRRSYSVGAFEYFVDEEAEIPFGHTNRRIVPGEKDDAPAIPAGEFPVPVASHLVGEGNNWLKDYMDNISSLTWFRNSGRFFNGSSRRNDVVGVQDFDVEANRFGEEISEMFRWVSGV